MSSTKPKLIWLLFMHRHGDRAMLNGACRDPYNNSSYWPEGFGNLNNKGRSRMYKLGQFIRRRYENFLTDNIREIYSRSSDVDRCIESSHAVLAGLYPPSDKFRWNPDLAWVPAPVHSCPPPDDYLLNESGRKHIDDIIAEIQKVQKSDEVKKLYQDSVQDRELLERELGYNFDMFYTFSGCYSNFLIEESAGLPLPGWVTPELKARLYKYAGLAFALSGAGTEKLRQLRCGQLLEDMLARMELASYSGPSKTTQSDFRQPTNAASDTSDRKVVHYSTHDSILSAFLRSINVSDVEPIPPGFGATWFMELYVDVDDKGNPVGEKYLKLFYLDDTPSEKPLEKVPRNAKLGPDGKLTLSSFRDCVKHLLPTCSNC